AVPLTTLEVVGLTNTRRFITTRLQQRYSRPVARASSLRGPAVSPLSHISRIDLFATSKSNLFIVEIGELVAAGFRDLGYAAELHLDQIPDATPSDDRLQIVVTPHEYYNLLLREKFSPERCQELTRGVYLLSTEQPETHWFEANVKWAACARGIADINPLGVAAYRARGLPARQLHLGYHPILAHREGENPHGTRDYDITFLGSKTDRRDEFFARHADFFSQHECHLRFVPLGFAKTKETRSYLSPDRRNQLLSDTRILLNVHYSEQKYFEWHRMLVGFANGCCIITETCQGYGALVPGKHFIMVEPGNLIDACEFYLANPDECERIARAGLEFVRRELRQADMCRKFLDGKSDSPADADGVPLPEPLRERISRARRRLFFDSLAEDFRKLRATPVPDEQMQEPNRAEVIRKREAYKARLIAQEEARSRGEEVWRVNDNAAFREVAEPELSIVITLFNYAHHIQECIDSVHSAAAHLSAPFEVIIVNDASTDDSLARARACQESNALPIRIVDKKFNTGLADARNTGTAQARAPYIFMLDADNLVFPQALAHLLPAIQAEDFDAAYSLLCRFRDRPSNRVGLLSYYDWDPQILVQYPYIDAMAMFRRETLLSLGGYDNQLSQIGWFGWEDYDMWLKYVQRGCRVAFVPNTFCLYRHHDTSMINTTNLFEADLVQHFLEKYGELLECYEPRERVFGVDRDRIVWRSDQRGGKASSNPGNSDESAGL
ncbi:MAG TPA: glycosyltransferase, partial [Chthoniobacterales bacterium]|nr:glycosyltransferase [Chthoniobacterales bacterium]